jgi:hypothetical protein
MLALWLALAAVGWAGPVDFGRQELERAIAERKLSPQLSRFIAEVSADGAESFRIQAGQISGGDMRGLMYGLLEAAGQIRERGRLLLARGAPAMPIRGVRLFIQAGDLEKDWYNSREFWQRFSETLARSRFNRLNLVFSRLSIEERDLEMLRYISQTASEYAIDFTLGLRADTAELWPDGALKRVLAACPMIRSVQILAGATRDEGSVALYRDRFFRPIREAGRRVTLELRGSDLTPALLKAATSGAAPLRISVRYSGVLRTPPPRPPSSQLIWELRTSDPAQRRPWSDPDFVRRTVVSLAQPGYAGFEIDPPLPPESDGDRLFYTLWGRLGYDPKTLASVWQKELKKR